jgi:hypothetical protein
MMRSSSIHDLLSDALVIGGIAAFGQSGVVGC